MVQEAPPVNAKLKNIIIVGEEKSGKTALMEKIIQNIPHKKGFLTREDSNILLVNSDGEIIESNKGIKVERVTYFVRPFFDGSFQEEVKLGYVDFSLSEENKVLRAPNDFTRLKPTIKSLMGKMNGDLAFADEITLMDGHAPYSPFYDLINKFLDTENPFIGTISPYTELDHRLPRDIAINLDLRSTKISDTARFELTPNNREEVYQQVMDLIPPKYKIAAA
ncbi:MAG: hypothetical protein AABX03_03735 [Nanoarchaeota archaeon]